MSANLRIVVDVDRMPLEAGGQFVGLCTDFLGSFHDIDRSLGAIRLYISVLHVSFFTILRNWLCVPKLVIRLKFHRCKSIFAF